METKESSLKTSKAIETIPGRIEDVLRAFAKWCPCVYMGAILCEDCLRKDCADGDICDMYHGRTLRQQAFVAGWNHTPNQTLAGSSSEEPCSAFERRAMEAKEIRNRMLSIRDDGEIRNPGAGIREIAGLVAELAIRVEELEVRLHKAEFDARAASNVASCLANGIKPD